VSKLISQKYRKGQSVLYKRKRNPESQEIGENNALLEEATIVEVHFDDVLEPYYSIRMTENGREKQTDEAHLLEKDDHFETNGGGSIQNVRSLEEIKNLQHHRPPQSKLCIDSTGVNPPKAQLQSECISHQHPRQDNGTQVDLLPKICAIESSTQPSTHKSHSGGDCTFRNQKSISLNECSCENESTGNLNHIPNNDAASTTAGLSLRTAKSKVRKLSGLVQVMVHPLTNRFVTHLKHIRQQSSHKEIGNFRPETSNGSKPSTGTNNSKTLFPPGYDGNDKTSKNDSRESISQARRSEEDKVMTASKVQKLSPLEEWSLRNEKVGDGVRKLKKPRTRLTENCGAATLSFIGSEVCLSTISNSCREKKVDVTTQTRSKLGNNKRSLQYIPCEEMDYDCPPHKRVRFADADYHDSTENEEIIGDRSSSTHQNASSPTNILCKMGNNFPIVAKRQKSKMFSRSPRRRPINIERYLSKHRRMKRFGLNIPSIMKSQSKGCQTQFISDTQLSSSYERLISQTKATELSTDALFVSDSKSLLGYGLSSEINADESTRKSYEKKSQRPFSEEHNVHSFSPAHETVMQCDDSKSHVETEQFFDCASDEVFTQEPSNETGVKEPACKVPCLRIDSNETLDYEGKSNTTIRAGRIEGDLSKKDRNESSFMVKALNGDFAHHNPPFCYKLNGNISASSYDHCNAPSHNHSFLVTNQNVPSSSQQIPYRMSPKKSSHMPHYPWWRNPSLQFPASNYPRYFSHNNFDFSHASERQYSSNEIAFGQHHVIPTYDFMPRKSSSATIDIDGPGRNGNSSFRNTVQNVLSSLVALLAHSIALVLSWDLFTSNSKPGCIMTKPGSDDPIAQVRKSSYPQQGKTCSGNVTFSRDRPNTSVYNADSLRSKKVTFTTLPHIPFRTCQATRPHPSSKMIQAGGKKKPPTSWTASCQKKTKVGDWTCNDCGLKYSPSETSCFLCATIGNITIELDEEVSTSTEGQSKSRVSSEPVSTHNHYASTESDKNNMNGAFNVTCEAPSSIAQLPGDSICHSKCAMFSGTSPNSSSDTSDMICPSSDVLSLGKKKRDTGDLLYADDQDHTKKLTRTSPDANDILLTKDRSYVVDMETDSVSSGSAMSCC